MRVQGSGFRVQGSGFRVEGWGVDKGDASFGPISRTEHGRGIQAKIATTDGHAENRGIP